MGEIYQRIISALLLGAAVLFITWWNPLSFDLLCLLAAGILAREWWGLTRMRSRWFVLFGALYIGTVVGSLMFLRALDVGFIYFLFAAVWAGDIGAYLVGKWIGKHKLAPHISPGKTWEGLGGSILATSVIIYFAGGAGPIFDFGIGVLLALTGLSGDLFESSLKRHAGVKDSGRLMPGHGGLFDRVDSLMACTLLVAAYMRWVLTQLPV